MLNEKGVNFGACALSAVLLGSLAVSDVSLAQTVVPIPPSKYADNAALMDVDTKMANLRAQLLSAESAKERFVALMEVTRIAAPSRQELHRMREVHSRFASWGFSADEIKTNTSTFKIDGAGLQTVDGLPVYNACVEIKGSYRDIPGAATYKGQYPKVVIEGHIDTVNPSALADLGTLQYEPVRLQPINQPIANTVESLAAISKVLNFGADGKLIEDANFSDAYVRYNDKAAAEAGNAYRIYVPGYSDAMANTINVLYLAKYIKQLGIKPHYDLWICGTAGEEGRGNLSGMKQLYGYNQDTGKGNNALNIVANFSIDGGGNTVNYLGSYRYEVQFTAKNAEVGKPSAATAAALSVNKIANFKPENSVSSKTTYTVGVVKCDDTVRGDVAWLSAPPVNPDKSIQNCSFEVDMRSPEVVYLNQAREEIYPNFQLGATTENRRLGVDDAVSMNIAWFGDRPAHVRSLDNPSDLDVAIYAAFTTCAQTGSCTFNSVPTGSSSLNDNVPAATGVPTINLNVAEAASYGGGHTFYEWGIPGNAAKEGKNVHRVLMTALLASGYNLSNGTLIEPLASDIPSAKWPLRTTEDMYK